MHIKGVFKILIFIWMDSILVCKTHPQVNSEWQRPIFWNFIHLPTLFRKLVNLRLYLLERNQHVLDQYGRRDTIEITGIPDDVDHDDLEQEVIDIFRDAKVTVNRQFIKPLDIQAVHVAVALDGGKFVVQNSR